MTTITFEENIKISTEKQVFKIYEFLEILWENWYIPVLKELPEDEITPEILNAYNESKKSSKSDFINL